MRLDEAKHILHENGYRLIDEGFFGDKYTRYKKAVLSGLKKYKVDIENNIKEIDEWIRDFFLDNIGSWDCVVAIRDNF